MNDVSKWLYAGAEVREGLRLLSLYAPNRHLEKIVSAAPDRYSHLLRKALTPFADDAGARAHSLPSSRRTFREDWPFLSNPACPIEIKALAADKISAWKNYCDLHEKLFDCDNLEVAFDTAKNLLENYRQNRLILAEFTYYKEHGRVLGKHPIFKESRKLSGYRKMSAFQLFKEQQRLNGAIWRIKSEMAKGDKPHLLAERQARLESKKRELAVVNDLMSDFEKQ